MTASGGSWRRRVARSLNDEADRLLALSAQWPDRPAAMVPRAAIEEVVAILHDCAAELKRPDRTAA